MKVLLENSKQEIKSEEGTEQHQQEEVNISRNITLGVHCHVHNIRPTLHCNTLKNCKE